MEQGSWIETAKELPDKDGDYEVCNNPEGEYVGTKRVMTGMAYYDGYGFQYLGIYRQPLYWRNLEKLEKKYGKIVNG